MSITECKGLHCPMCQAARQLDPDYKPKLFRLVTVKVDGQPRNMMLPSTLLDKIEAEIDRARR